MSRAARSVFVFSFYLFATAATLILAPNLLLRTLGVAPTTEPWIRVLGVVVAVIGTYYFSCARSGSIPFFRATLPGRFGVLLGFSGLVALGYAPTPILLFGLVDAAGAIWTWRALLRDHPAP